MVDSVLYEYIYVYLYTYTHGQVWEGFSQRDRTHKAWHASNEFPAAI